METIWGIVLIALIYFGYHALKAQKKIEAIYSNLSKPLSAYFTQCENLEDQKKMSWLVLSAHLKCLPDKVHSYYFSFLKNSEFTIEELRYLKKLWALKKYDEAKELQIDFEITPAAIMETLTNKYINQY